MCVGCELEQGSVNLTLTPTAPVPNSLPILHVISGVSLDTCKSAFVIALVVVVCDTCYPKASGLASASHEHVARIREYRG